MSNYNYTCPCCKRLWHCNSTGKKPTKAQLLGEVCKLCK